MSTHLDELKVKYDHLCSTISDKWPSLLTEPSHDGSPHVEWIQNQYHFVITERGMELEHLKTEELDQILYWLLSNFVGWLAADFEFRHREKGVDFRRLMFKKQVEFMEALHPTWGRIKKTEIEAELVSSPYDDSFYGAHVSISVQ